jgi:hypothetical protein
MSAFTNPEKRLRVNVSGLLPITILLRGSRPNENMVFVLRAAAIQFSECAAKVCSQFLSDTATGGYAKVYITTLMHRSQICIGCPGWIWFAMVPRPSWGKWRVFF